MVNKYIDFITCKICPDTVVFQSLKRRPLFMGLYALEEFRNYGHRFTFLYNKLLINENDMKIWSVVLWFRQNTACDGNKTFSFSESLLYAKTK